MKLSIALLVGMILRLSQPAVSAAELQSVDGTIDMLVKLERDLLISNDAKKGEFAGLYKEARYGEGAEDGGNALLQLWQFEGARAVLVEWYRSPSRSTRLIVLSIYYSIMNPEIGSFPHFKSNAERFKDPEAKERLEEIEYVEHHRIEIKVRMTMIASKFAHDSKR